jgi:hypothetical protein
MKTIIALVLCLNFNQLLHAQESNESHFSYPQWEIYAAKPQTKKQVVTIYTIDKKGKHLSQTVLFNTNGLMERNIYYTKNGKVRSEGIEYYNDSNKVTEFTTYKKRKFYSEQKYQYATNLTQVTRVDYYFKDSVHVRRYILTTYYPNGKYQRNTGYDKKGVETYRYEYDLYENGSKKETRNYNKGKLKYRWVYDCDWRGELSESKERQVKICQNRVYDTDSSYTEVNENTIKNKVTKTITKATKDGRILVQELYNAKGKLLSKTVCQYNDAKKLVKQLLYEKKNTSPTYMELFEYNTDNYLISSAKFDKGSKVQDRKEFRYN